MILKSNLPPPLLPPARQWRVGLGGRRCRHQNPTKDTHTHTQTYTKLKSQEKRRKEKKKKEELADKKSTTKQVDATDLRFKQIHYLQWAKCNKK